MGQPLQPNVQYVVRTSLPQPGARDALIFNGQNASSFLRRFKDMCEDYGLNDNKEVLRRLPDYCEVMIGGWMRSLSSYEHRDWVQFCADVKKEFESSDIDQKTHSRGYLEDYKSQPRTTNGEIRGYVREYTALSASTLRKGDIDEFTRCLWFLQGLPDGIRTKVVRRTGIDPEVTQTMTFVRTKGSAVNCLEADRRDEKLMDVGKQPVGLLEMAREYEKAHAGEARAPPVHHPVQQEEFGRKMDRLADGFAAMSLPLQAIAARNDLRNAGSSELPRVNATGAGPQPACMFLLRQIRMQKGQMS